MVQFTKRPPMMCNQIRKVSSAPISYHFSRNGSFDDRNISSEPILIGLKIDGLFKVWLPPKLASRENPILVPFNRILQGLSRENVVKIHKNVFKSELDTQNVSKWSLTNPVGLFSASWPDHCLWLLLYLVTV